jgi:hypothetical protein
MKGLNMHHLRNAYSGRILAGLGDDFKYPNLEGVTVVFAPGSDSHNRTDDDKADTEKEGYADIIAGCFGTGGHEATCSTGKEEADYQYNVAHGSIAPLMVYSLPIVSDFVNSADIPTLALPIAWRGNIIGGAK